jgi:glycosyltransferase involved in cell wall biosynthesis
VESSKNLKTSVEIKVTVVTVTYNAEKVIEKTLKSIISQDYNNKEIVVIDGESKDSTIEIINNIVKDVDIFISEKDAGIYDAMNKSLEFATGDFLIFMNAGDSFYSIDTISNVVKCITDKRVIYYGNAVYFSENLKEQITRGGAFDKYRLATTNLCHQTIFYPISVYKSLKYNIDYSLFADWDYNMRCFKNAIEFEFINQVIAYYDYSGLSLTQRDLNFERDFKKIIFSNMGLLPALYLGLRKYYRILGNIKLWR